MSLLSSKNGSSGGGTATANKKPNRNFAGSKAWFVGAIIAAIIAAALAFIVLSKALSTSTYYVLNTDVPARSQISASMLTPVSASTGTEPRNAISLDDVSYSTIYAKVPLNTGDVLSESNAGDLAPMQEGLPDNFVVASFVADANTAVSGKLQAGNYIDIYATQSGGNTEAGSTGAGSTKSVLRHVLITDVSASVADYESDESETDTTSAQDDLRKGIPSVYTVGLSEEDAATLANITGNQDTLFVVLSSKQSSAEYQSKDVQTNTGKIFGNTKVNDSGAGTSSDKATNGAGETPVAGASDSASKAPASEGSSAPSEETSAGASQ